MIKKGQELPSNAHCLRKIEHMGEVVGWCDRQFGHSGFCSIGITPAPQKGWNLRKTRRDGR